MNSNDQKAIKLVPVIVCGGAGTRLWPVSRVTHPKPFMELPGGESLLQKTYLRSALLRNVVEIMTVTNRDLYFKTDDVYRQAGRPFGCSYVLEPFGRNTAAAITAAAFDIFRVHGPDAVMLALPADHLIDNIEAFDEAVDHAVCLATSGWMVTFGIHPDYPETGFGYIQFDPEQELLNGFKVKRFVEKPDFDTAAAYVDDGGYLWNSGMFCFTAGDFLAQMERHAPDVYVAVGEAVSSASSTSSDDVRCLTLDAEKFLQVPDISIDYALMERSEKVATVPCDIGWSDIGSWSAMSQLLTADDSGNRIEGDVLTYSSNDNYVVSKERLAALVGVKDLLVVDTPDALLIAHKDHAQDVRHIVSQLKGKGHHAHLLHRTVHRPWGSYTVLEEGAGFKIKRLVVKPGASLSLQMHHHRSEHWVVVSGMARVVNDDREFLLNANESTFISAGHRHRLANPGVLDLVMIEVQSGSYLGEDDIVRFQDDYGRQ